MPQDSTKAANWCRKATEQGNAEAQFSLRASFVEGQGVLKDHMRQAQAGSALDTIMQAA